MIQALGIAYSKIVLPSSDSKGESKGRTYCPTTWNTSYQWPYASQYADQLRQAKASSLQCKECTLLVRVQLSNKNANHPNCAFADSMSTTMCGAVISLTPCIAPMVERDCDLHESAEFKDAADMIQHCSSMAYWRSPLAFHRFLFQGKIAIHSMPSPMSDTSSMSSVQSRIVNGLSTCQTRTQAWLKQLAFKIIHCEHRGSRITTNGRRSPTRASRPPRMRGYGRKAVLPNGPLLLREDLPREANLFLLIRLSVQIQRKRVFHGETLER